MTNRAQKQVDTAVETTAGDFSLMLKRDELETLLASITNGGLVRITDDVQIPASRAFIVKLDEYIDARWAALTETQGL